MKEKKLKAIVVSSKIILLLIASLFILLTFLVGFYFIFFSFAVFMFFVISLIELRVKTVIIDGNTITAYSGWANLILIINDDVVDKYTGMWLNKPKLSSVLPDGKVVECVGVNIKVAGKHID